MERGPMSTLIEQVKQYALDHYTDGGWDVIVECWSDAEIAVKIGSAATLEEALNEFRPLVEVWADRQADARNSAF